MANITNKSNASSLLIDIGQGLSLRLGLPKLTYWDIKSRPKKPKRGTFGFNTETNSLEYFNGTHWLEVAMKKT